jgi:hypothetical protein
MQWILSSCLIASPHNQSYAIIHHNSCSSFVYNGNISHNLLARLESHDPLVVHLSHLLQHSKNFYRLQKMFKMLRFFCNPLPQHQKTCMWRDVLWITIVVILHTIYTSRTLKSLDNTWNSIVKWRFLKSFKVQNHCTKGSSHNNMYHSKCNIYLVFSCFKIII